MLRRTVCAILVVVMFASLIVGCGGKASENTPPASSTQAAGTAAETTVQQTQAAVNEWDKMKEEEHELNITLAPSYLTDELWKELLDGFQKDHPKWKITREINAEAGKQDQAKILAGNAPAFFQGDWQNFSIYQALEAGVLADIEDLMNAPAYDTPGKTVAETMLPGYDNVMMKDSKRYLFCYRYGTNGIWINKKMFNDNGWEVPKTWDEFTSLCEKIKAKNITPLIFTGTYTPYPLSMFNFPIACELGNGLQTAKDMNNLVPGSWSGSNMKTTLERFVDIYQKGYFTKDVLGTDFTQAQVLFFQGKAAMVLSGSWLEGEMKDQIPAGFEFDFIAPPGVDSVDKQRLVPIFTVGLMFSKGAKQEKEAKELTRYWFSSKFMKSYAEKFGEPTITQNIVQLDESKFSKAAISIKNCLEDPTVKTIPMTYSTWYKSLEKIIADGSMGIIAGNESIDSLLQKVEAEVVRIKSDSNIAKYNLE